MKKVILLIPFLLLLSGCSFSSLNPFKSEPVYYIEGDEIGKSNYNPKKYKGGGYTSKARHKATMKTYCVKGKVYHPTYVEVGDTMTGIASWYGPDFHGLQTSNGERYNMFDMTVAHKTWPMDTMVKITNLENGKSAIARINDRGPFVAGRIVDCSYAVAKKIGIDKKGTCQAKLEVVGFAGKIYKPSSHKPKPKVKLTNFGVQVGAFAMLDNAKALKNRYEKLICDNQFVKIKRGQLKTGEMIHRVWVMGFESEEEAKDFITANNISGAFVVRD